MVLIIDLNQQSLIAFYHQVKDKLVPLYKSSVIALQAYANIDDINDRTIPPIRLALLQDDEDELIVVIDIFKAMYENTHIFFGLPVGIIGEDNLNCPIFKNNDECYDYLTGEPISTENNMCDLMSVKKYINFMEIFKDGHEPDQKYENEKIDSSNILYDCNCCNEHITGKKYSCLECNFDLCSNEECLKMKAEHPHELFENDDYFGIGLFSCDQCVTQVTIHI